MRRWAAVSIIAAATSLSAATARADSQMLGLVATEGPVPLACEGSTCTARLSAFCLEKDRPNPAAEAVYHPVGRAGITLEVTSPQGVTRSLPAKGRLSIAAVGGMAAVMVSLDRAAAGIGPDERVAVRVGARVSLLPVEEAGDPRRHQPDEIAEVAGVWRALGERVVDKGGAQIAAARSLDKVISTLPAGRTTAPGIGKAAWRTALGRAPDPRSTNAGFALASRHFASCAAALTDMARPHRKLVGITAYWGGQGIIARPGLRQCLEGRHDGIMTRLNRRYWELKGTGS
jgi:hypothetical protein